MSQSTAAAQLLDIESPWDRVSEKLKSMYGESVHRSWIRPIEFIGIEGGKALLAVPTRFMREWIASHYGKDIHAALREARPDVLAVDILVRGGEQVTAPA